MGERPWQVILLPGGVMPAEPAYGALLTELGSDVDSRAKDLEVYAGDEPPPDYSLATEVAGINRVADEAGSSASTSSVTRVVGRRHSHSRPAAPSGS